MRARDPILGRVHGARGDEHRRRARGLRALVMVLSALPACGSSKDAGTVADGAMAVAVRDAGPVDVLGTDIPVQGGGGEVPVGVSTLAGSADTGLVDGPGVTALFNDPVNVAMGPDGFLYVADFRNGAIRRLTPDGEARTLARGLTGPAGLAFDTGGALLVSGDDGHLSRIDVATGAVAVLASGLGVSRGLAALGDGRFVATALDQHVVWLIGPDGSKTVLAGAMGTPGLADAVGGAARFDQPVDVVVTSTATLLVADLGNDRIRAVARDGSVTTFAGTSGGFLDGPLSRAQFDGPSGLALDALGNVYVSDRFNYRLREITAAGQVVTLAGNGTLGFLDGVDPLASEFAGLEGIDFVAPGTLYVADGNALILGGFHRVRRLRLGP